MWPLYSLSAILLLLARGAQTAQSGGSPRLVPIPAQPGHGMNATLAKHHAKAGIDKTPILLAKRQGACRYDCDYCCDDGVCASSSEDKCCGGYYCDAGETCGNTRGCCSPGTKACHDGCIENDAECCQSVGWWCEPGQHCYLIDGYRPVCCPLGGCYDDDYTTSTITEYTTATYDYTTTDYTTTDYISTSWDWDYYSWTYWVTFYTYYIPSSTYLRTSTTTTTTTIVSVYATDTVEASSLFDEISPTLTYTIPSTATDPTSPTRSDTETLGPEATGGGGGMVMMPGLLALHP
ncbi:hypothetical protein BDW59DRAFT_177937 [Aspergillus cavernicola]|uniref:Uncharacterized protein n=1 Tax=Aspergillus cavernicola TaxID=176166 RepID=A0ABR4HG95_9EURO